MTAEASPNVPPELVGREASVQLILPFFDVLQKRGIPAEVLARGTGYALSHLQNRRERISWAALMIVMQNLGRLVTDEELIAIGASLLDNPVHRAMILPGRLLFSLPEIFRWGVSPGGPLAQLLVVQDMTITEIDARTLRFDTKMKPGYTCAREFWLTRLGFVRSVSRAFGLPLADVVLTVTDAGASYDIALPPETSLSSRVRKRASWLFAARGIASELSDANENLHFRYRELQREVEARKDAEEKLRVLNAELEQRVLDRTSELARANRDLAAMNAELSLFSTSVAHDLRAPLRSINGFANALVEDHSGELSDRARSHLSRVIAGSTRMAELVDALLALSRITRVEVRREDVDLGEVARGVLEDLRAGDPARAAEITIDPEMRTVGDPTLVRALMVNLLGNAWKFTRGRAPARIEVSCVDAPTPVFRIRDNGVGFDMQRAASLFSPFHRLHPLKEFDGVGIGLAIVDRVIRRHGGKIWVDAAPDAGATFTFTLAPERI